MSSVECLVKCYELRVNEFKVNKSKLEHLGRLGNGQFFTLKVGKGFYGGVRPGSEGMI